MSFPECIIMCLFVLRRTHVHSRETNAVSICRARKVPSTSHMHIVVSNFVLSQLMRRITVIIARHAHIVPNYRMFILFILCRVIRVGCANMANIAVGSLRCCCLAEAKKEAFAASGAVRRLLAW